MFSRQDRQFIKDLGRLIWWSGLIGIKINEGFFNPDKKGVDRGHSKERAIKGSLLWKLAKNIEMINSKDRVLLTNLEIIHPFYHSNLEYIMDAWKHEKINNDK